MLSNLLWRMQFLTQIVYNLLSMPSFVIWHDKSSLRSSSFDMLKVFLRFKCNVKIGKLGIASAVAKWQEVCGPICVLRFWAWIQNQSTILLLWNWHFQAKKVVKSLVLEKIDLPVLCPPLALVWKRDACGQTGWCVELIHSWAGFGTEYQLDIIRVQVTSGPAEKYFLSQKE